MCDLALQAPTAAMATLSSVIINPSGSPLPVAAVVCIIIGAYVALILLFLLIRSLLQVRVFDCATIIR
jgi:hypothetical protein